MMLQKQKNIIRHDKTKVKKNIEQNHSFLKYIPCIITTRSLNSLFPQHYIYKTF
jgi:hypothetical protein